MYFEELIKRISPKLKSIAHRLNGHFTFFNDEDLYQEAMGYLWEEFCAGRLEKNTDSYILQGCYFYLKNYLRKIKDKVKLISLDTLIDEEDKSNLKDILCIENQTNFFGSLANRMLIEEINNDGLTEREKEVLKFCLEGLTVREIGKRLGISHVRVIKIKNNIKRKLNYFKLEYLGLPK